MSRAGLDASWDATVGVAGCDAGVVAMDGVVDAAVAPAAAAGDTPPVVLVGVDGELRTAAFCAALTRSVATDLPAATAPFRTFAARLRRLIVSAMADAEMRPARMRSSTASV